MKIRLGNTKHIIELLPSAYVASGGEGSIYKINSSSVAKLYHDPDKKSFPIQKMKELSIITNPQVVIPQELIYDIKDGKSLGYTTKFVDKADPLVKLFTRTFKDSKNVSFKMVNELVKQIQLIVADIHSAKCLVVDLNELNILVDISASTIIPWFIDVDSYCTPSFKATAVMDSIRDRKASLIDKNKVLHYNPTIESDWFSFAVLAFNLYVNIHPYRGGHKDYKPNEKKRQMDDGVSVFHSGVRVPPSVNDFKVIPSRHLDWFKQIFLNNDRSIPPLPDSSIPTMVPSQIVTTTISSTDKIIVNEIQTYGDNIIDVFYNMGLYYVATKTHFYVDNKEIGTHNAKRVLFCAASDGTLITAQQDNSDKIVFKELTKSDSVGTATSNNMFSRNNSIYTISRGKLVENSFTAFGNKIIHRINEIENISVTSATMYDGCVVQDLLGKMYLTLPYKLGSCFSKHIPQLDGYRVISAKSDKYVTVVLGEKKGQYDRFIIVFDKHYTKFDIRKVEDVSYDTINFAVMDNGLCALLASPTELELFSTAFQCEVLANPPFDSTMKLIATPDGLFFIMNNSIHQIRKK